MSSKDTVTAKNMAVDSDERVVFLDEVHFKWLLAGLGLWIDLSRYRTDPTYAAHVLGLAEVSESHALRECASSLRHQNTATS